MSYKHTILCVDDEQHNLDALHRTLRKEYNVLTALSGPEGLALLQDTNISLIISDQRMPHMSGVEFLDKSIAMRPDVVRIILTGFTDVEDLIGAINTGQVYRYITKPWDPIDLKITIKRALENLELTAENRRLFEDVIRLEKLATVGQVASGIAHEIRNQLSVLMGVQILQQKHPDDEFIETIAEQTIMARDRILTILNDIKSFGKQTNEELAKNALPASLILKLAIDILSFDHDTKKIEFDIQISTDPVVYCDQNRIIQVLINLARNAAQAQNCEGTIIFKAEESDNKVLFHVIDSGGGIPSDIQDKIWQPFFTTKGDQGTGLGLQISKRILESHNGNLFFDSTTGQGTTFTLELPSKL